MLFVLSVSGTSPNFTSIPLLALKLWQFFLIRDWPEIRKLEIHPLEFCSISGVWGKFEMSNLTRLFLIKCYWMLQNARVTAFTVSELLRENQQRVKLVPPLPIYIRVKPLFDLYLARVYFMLRFLCKKSSIISITFPLLKTSEELDCLEKLVIESVILLHTIFYYCFLINR